METGDVVEFLHFEGMVGADGQTKMEQRYSFIFSQEVMNCPAAQRPTAKVPKEKMPTEKTPTEKRPTEKRPAEKIPTEKSPAESTPALNKPPDSHPEAAEPTGMALGKGGDTKPMASRTSNTPQMSRLAARRVIATPVGSQRMKSVRALDSN